MNIVVVISNVTPENTATVFVGYSWAVHGGGDGAQVSIPIAQPNAMNSSLVTDAIARAALQGFIVNPSDIKMVAGGFV